MIDDMKGGNSVDPGRIVRQSSTIIQVFRQIARIIFI
jgi:hypothetical protein